MNCLGIDIYHGDTPPDFRQLREQDGVSFCFAKANQGANPDPMFETFWRQMGEDGLTRGAYDFFNPGLPGAVQAATFLSRVKLGQSDMPAVLDLEQGSGFAADALAWLQMVEQATGKTPIIYGSPWFLQDNLSAEFGRYHLWISEYGVSEPRIPTWWTQAAFWQFDQAGSNGHTYDVNYFMGGDHDALVEHFHLRG